MSISLNITVPKKIFTEIEKNIIFLTRDDIIKIDSFKEFHFEKYNLYNAGRDDWNFSVSEIAHAVQDNMPECKISINKDAAPDKRSYKVNFNKFNTHFPNALNSEKTFSTTIKETFACVALIKDLDENFRNSDYIRLKVLQKLKANRSLKSNLEWNF